MAAAHEAWLALRREQALDPALPIVDAHHHLWDATAGPGGPHVGVGRPGGAGAAVDPAVGWPKVPRYLLADALADMDGSGHNVVGSVYCECGSMYRGEGPVAERPLGETEFVTGMAAMAASGTFGATRVCAGITGTADLALGPTAIGPVLRAHLGLPNFRAIRTPIPSRVEQPEEHERWRESIELMQELDILYEQNDPVEPHLLQLARDFPRLIIVLCHCTGTHTWSEAEAQAWRDGIEALSKCPNVVAKLGGAGSPHRGFGLVDRPVPVGSEELADMVLPWYAASHRASRRSSDPLLK